MKKSTLIIILIIYIASIAVINFFGMTAKVYNEIINVTKVECINETNDRVEVKINSEGKKILKVKYEEPANEENLTGTMLQLAWHVYPDNATKKDVQFVFNRNNDHVKFYKDEKGRETGLILFTGKAMLDVKIMSTDGTKTYTTVLVWAY